MGGLSPEYEDLQMLVAQQKKVIARKRKLLDVQVDMLTKLLEDCTHEELDAEESYYSGSYYDKAYTNHWNKCRLCGKTSKKTTEMHSWYG